MTSPHEMFDPPQLAAPRGYSHAVAAAPGRTVWVAGQIAVDAAGAVRGDDFTAQFDLALENVVTALRAAGAEPEHVVAMTIYTTTMDEYRASTSQLAPVWRSHMGRHYPAMAMLGVTELVAPDALVEILAVAVVPQGS